MDSASTSSERAFSCLKEASSGKRNRTGSAINPAKTVVGSILRFRKRKRAM